MHLACIFSAILHQNFLTYTQYACVVFAQSDEKSDFAIYMQSLCGIVLSAGQQLFIQKHLLGGNLLIYCSRLLLKRYNPAHFIGKLTVLHTCHSIVKLLRNFANLIAVDFHYEVAVL